MLKFEVKYKYYNSFGECLKILKRQGWMAERHMLCVACMWKSEGNFVGFVPSFHPYIDSMYQTQVTRLALQEFLSTELSHWSLLVF